MVRWVGACGTLCWAAALGCGAAGGTDGGASETEGAPSTGNPIPGVTLTASPSGDDSGSGTAEGTADGASSSATDPDDTSNGTGIIEPDLPPVIPCEPRDAVAALPYIWVANASQGTISKINTQTVLEEARYIVRPDGNGNPSRTSVAFDGDVVVANRAGGVTKIYAGVGDCQDSNGDGEIQTSSDSTALAWGVEECVAWHIPFAYTSNRPVAWTPGFLDEEACAYEGANVWTAGALSGNSEVLLLDGETGAVLATIDVPFVQAAVGLYGGAVDSAGNFWAVETNQRLVRVDHDDYSVQWWPTNGNPAYGITVDEQGRPFLCGGGFAARFDPVTELFDALPAAGMGLGGCATDGQGLLWHGRFGSARLVGIDTTTLAVVADIAIPAYVHGVSVDFEGYVWGVSFNGTTAYRVDPSTEVVDTVTGLVGVYTYSDMTGLALAAVSGLL